MGDDIVAPRQLTAFEVSNLRHLLYANFNVADDSAAEDAAYLLDYAFEMIEDGKSVGHVKEELNLIGMDVCTEEDAERLGECLSKFLEDLDKLDDSLKSDGDGDSEVYLSLSAAAAASKPTKEMREALGHKDGEVWSAKEKSKLSLYNEKGQLMNFRDNEEDEEVDDGTVPSDAGSEVIKSSAKSLARKASNEVKSILVSKSEKESFKERGKHAIYDERGVLVNFKENENDPIDGDITEINVSAKALARKPSTEVKKILLSKGEGETTFKEQGKKAIYDDKEKLVTERDKIVDTGEKEDEDLALFKMTESLKDSDQKSRDEQRMQELQAVMSDRSLSKEERKRRLEEIRNRYSEKQGDEDTTSVRSNNSKLSIGSSIDLSARAFARKPSKEIDELFHKKNQVWSAKEKSQRSNYNEKGELVSQWHNDDDECDGEERFISVNHDGESVFGESVLTCDIVTPGAEDESDHPSIDPGEVVAPRKLTENEASSLRTLLQSQLRINSDDSAEDASFLLDYAFDMIESGQNVDYVTEELKNVGMEACDIDAADRIKLCLSTFLQMLPADDHKALPKLVVNEPGLDVSAQALAKKPSLEMKAILMSNGEGVSAKEQSKNAIYNEKGEMVVETKVPQSKEVSAEEYESMLFSLAGCLQESDKQLLKEKRLEELHALMKDRSLSRDERKKRMDEVKAKYSFATDNDDEISNSGLTEATSEASFASILDPSIDVSASASVEKSSKEIKALTDQVWSKKERSQRSMYNENGELISQWNRDEEDETSDHEKPELDVSAKAAANRGRKEIEALRNSMQNDDPYSTENFSNEIYDYEEEEEKEGEINLSAKAAASRPYKEIEALRASRQGNLKSRIAAYSGQSELTTTKSEEQEQESDINLSAKAAANKPKKEIEILRKHSGSVKERMAAYSRGSLKTSDQEDTEGPSINLSAKAAAMKPTKEIEQLRTSASLRGSLQDRAAVYNKNGALESTRNSSEEDVGGINLSAQAAANKPKKEIEALREKAKQGGIKERMAQYNKSVNFDSTVSFNRKISGGSGGSARRVAPPQKKEVKYVEVLDKGTLDDMRRKETQAIMRNRSLSAEERRKRLQEVKEKYGTHSKSKQTPKKSTVKNSSPQPTTETVKTTAAESVTPSESSSRESLEDKRKKEVQSIMRDRSLNVEERRRRIQEVKAKYQALSEESQKEKSTNHESTVTTEVSEEKASKVLVGKNAEEEDHPNIDLSAKAFAEKPLRELEALKAKAKEGKGLKDRMAAYNQNTSAVAYNPMTFALEQNRAEKERRMAKRETKESAKYYNYKFGDAGCSDETYEKLKEDDELAKSNKHNSRTEYVRGRW